MMKNRSTYSFNNMIWGTMFRSLRMFFPLVLRGFIIREIGAHYVGLEGVFGAILSILNLTELGFGTAVVFMMYKPAANNDLPTMRILLGVMRKFYIIIGSVILVIGCLCIPTLNIIVRNDTGADMNIYLLYIMYLFQTVGSYFSFAYRSSLFTVYQRQDVIFKILFFTSLVEYGLKISVLIFTKNYYLYILVFALMIIPQNICYYVYSKKMFPNIYPEGKPTTQMMNTVKKKIMALIGHRLGATVMFSIDSIIISAFIGLSVLIKYDNYNVIMNSIINLLGVILTSLVASVGNKLVLDSRQETYQLFKRISFLWIAIVGWCTACLLSLYQPFISLWVGEEYCFDEGIVICICLYFFVWQFRKMGFTMKDAAGLWEPDKLKPYVGMMLNLIFSILFVKLTGSVYGVLAPTIVIILTIYFPWETYALMKYLFIGKTKDYLLFMAKCVASALIGLLVTYIVMRIIPNRGIVAIALRLVVGSMTFGLSYLLLNINSVQLKESAVMFRSILSRKLLR